MEKIEEVLTEQSQLYHVIPISVWVTNYQTVDIDKRQHGEIFDIVRKEQTDEMKKFSVRSDQDWLLDVDDRLSQGLERDDSNRFPSTRSQNLQ
jgi:hypothetical protein